MSDLPFSARLLARFGIQGAAIQRAVEILCFGKAHAALSSATTSESSKIEQGSLGKREHD